MSRFKRQRQRTVPALNVASLPDLIFTVLFFFMIVTHMRDVDPKVQYNVPEGTELTKEVNKSGLVYLFIGKPVDAQGRVIADETRIQMGNRYVTVDEIGAEIEKERNRMSEDDRQRLTVSIRADRDTEMGLINDVKQALRKAGALNINYSATKEMRKD
ncbi:MAG: biopolymer transporter ExbD [Prevotella sp.]|nr:biopolymer transporter ExbD [uncultured Prevotella sp.]MBO6191837.1 biopolymer transporter ExbD [Prevotella sp.]MBR1879259.1 biopolymer transporter ExbD [Prevotella sp.]